MLIEIRSDKFRTGSIEFHSGLNVILGDSNGTNSIGKSMLLMVIDFAFGGNSLLDYNKDLTQELGHHNYFFTFEFEDGIYRFMRSTEQSDMVCICDEEYNQTSIIAIENYTAFLKGAYGITISDITFRALAGLYSRIWGKDNLNVRKPIHAVQNQSAGECVNNLIKTFDFYAPIRELSESLKAKDEERKALRVAYRNNIIPKISKRDYAQNEEIIEGIEGEIADIKLNLASYATNIAQVLNREMLELKVEKDRLLSLRLNLESQLVRVSRNIAGNRHIKSRHFAALIKFFPSMDQDRLASVEEFHSGVAKLLGAELRESEKSLREQISRITEDISMIDSKMKSTLTSVKEPSRIVDRVYDLATALREAKVENEQYEGQVLLDDAVETLRNKLSGEKTQVIQRIEATVNDGLRAVVDAVFGQSRKSPEISISEYNYSYEVFEDTGTGTAYANLIVFDLTIFEATVLPFIAHDSLLFKNIENHSVANLLEVYLGIDKQSFVAIDEIEKYGPKAAELLNERSVIQLSNEDVLYIKDWRKKE